jgi:hypothetical protein
MNRRVRRRVESRVNERNKKERLEDERESYQIFNGRVCRVVMASRSPNDGYDFTKTTKNRLSNQT